jgi:catechol 2,3-dioxygenase-like lactoylglutathione lyase family enzyme
MLHHVSFSVLDVARSAAFYDAALGSLAYHRVWSFPTAIGYGLGAGGDKFAIKLGADTVAPSAGFHLAFAARTNADVDELYANALLNGGTDNGPPGLRMRYGPDYYAAFVIDPDGYRIEAVTKSPTRVP